VCVRMYSGGKGGGGGMKVHGDGEGGMNESRATKGLF
jgi:hypothetical protein